MSELTKKEERAILKAIGLSCKHDQDYFDERWLYGPWANSRQFEPDMVRLVCERNNLFRTQESLCERDRGTRLFFNGGVLSELIANAQWTHKDDGLPERDSAGLLHECIVSSDVAPVVKTGTSYQHSDNTWRDEFGSILYGVVAWMYAPKLPAPYTEDFGAGEENNAAESRHGEEG